MNPAERDGATLRPDHLPKFAPHPLAVLSELFARIDVSDLLICLKRISPEPGFIGRGSRKDSTTTADGVHRRRTLQIQTRANNK
jgi:hypothetical protein